MDKSRIAKVLTTGSEKSTITLNDAIILGSELQFLNNISGKSDTLEGDSVDIVFESFANIDRILTQRAVESQALQIISELINDVEEESEGSEEIPSEMTKEIKEKSLACMHLLAREFQDVQTIPVSDAGLLDLEKLLDSPNNLFSTTVWEWLDDMPRNDLREACRSIAVENYTSAVILSLRAVEYCLLEWHEEETGEDIDAPWGMVLNILIEYHLSDEVSDGTLPEQLSDLPPVLSNLYYLKEKRNQVNHPKKSPTAETARRTLMIAVSTIEDIHSELELEESTQSKTELLEKEPSRDTLSPDEMVVYRTIRNLNSGQPVSRNELYDLLQEEEDFEPSEVDDIIIELLMNGYIYEPNDNSVKSIYA